MIDRYFIPLLGVAMVISACRTQQAEEKSVVLVKADSVRAYQNELQITYPGRIKAAAEVDLAFRVAGPIFRIPVEVGSFVRKGDVVAEIDPRDYQIQFNATEAEYKQVKAEAERVIELYNRKSVPVNDYDKAVSGLRQITSKYEAHRNALNDTRLLAPFDGYIQKKYFDADETVGAGMSVISIIDTRYFEIEIDLPSIDYIRQDRFQEFSCVADVFPERVFPLELIDITKKANLNQLYRMRMRLKPQENVKLAAGMSVNVTIKYAADENELTTVPLSAVFNEGELAAVWVYEPIAGQLSKRKVRIQQILKTGNVILSEGVRKGEIVVTAGVHKLKEGMAVKLLKPVASSNVGGLL